MWVKKLFGDKFRAVFGSFLPLLRGGARWGYLEAITVVVRKPPLAPPG